MKFTDSYKFRYLLPWTQSVDHHEEKFLMRSVFPGEHSYYYIRFHNNTWITHFDHKFLTLEEAIKSCDEQLEEMGWIFITEERAEKLRLLI